MGNAFDKWVYPVRKSRCIRGCQAKTLCTQRKRALKWFKTAIISSLFFSITFSLVSAIFYYGEWDRMAIVAAFGVFTGLLAAPEFDKKAFKKPALFQTTSGLLAGATLGAFFTIQLELIILSSLIGGFLGWLAPFWLKYIQIP